ncbi:MAG: phosphoribosylformylglycinamidine synthase subunit PurL [Chloroflexi bacterium]|nr:MAG: phosphoribosylformylglycinamidine synthase subunit PurL [Chloroflexota bacterium]TMD74510.1 MAG: phosphoribosylformylglycinamidine synthase subunit PurL [Chloroflexota bacterium]
MKSVDERKLREVALTPDEYRVILEQLKRAPNEVELGMLGVLWSEHCSYKSSKALLRRLPSTGSAVLQGPGENAGAVSIGEGWAVVFKIESHNHPSAIEPYQGAATGVGGIIRDVIAMGARPIALLDSLRFGPLPESARHFEGVVAGIGGYGNCIGIPTVGGEIYFEDCYANNPLVNAMCVGLVRTDQLMRARAEGVGNSILLVGADTGRDGIHGASFASLELDENSSERRPAVQVGNPFLEKCLLEACMDLSHTDAVVAIQDLGAAGLTSAVAECAGRVEGAGARIDVGRVPRRERGMTPYDLMLSESQERMLVVVQRGREREVESIFHAWDLTSAVIGEVTDDGHLTVFDSRDQVARLPVRLLTDGAPVRRLVGIAPEPPLDLVVDALPPLADAGATLLRLLASPNLASRRGVFRRYDHMVGDATVVAPGGDAAMLRVKGTRLGLAMTVDCNGRYCHLDPHLGAQLAVAEAARNIISTGARPIAVTDCLNLANPDRPEVYWELEETVAGLAYACRAMDLPIVSGNVSLYNDSNGESAIYPTPVVGMVGVIDDYGKRLGGGFRADGDFVLLIGSSQNDLGGSEYLKVEHGYVAGRPPALDLTREQAVNRVVLAAAQSGYLHSAHDCAEGGMLIALAECSLLGGIGVRCPAIRPEPPLRLDAAFFGESPSRYVVSVPSRAMPEMQSLARRHHVELSLLGLTGGDTLEFEGQLKLSLDELRGAWEVMVG